MTRPTVCLPSIPFAVLTLLYHSVIIVSCFSAHVIVFAMQPDFHFNGMARCSMDASKGRRNGMNCELYWIIIPYREFTNCSYKLPTSDKLICVGIIWEFALSSHHGIDTTLKLHFQRNVTSDQIPNATRHRPDEWFWRRSAIDIQTHK